jgi:ankyrin repeat protein
MERSSKLLESLSFNYMHTRWNTIEKAHGDTCDWFFQLKAYSEWLDPRPNREGERFLWIKGKPGAGKSTIMKHIHRQFLHYRREHVVLAFFFNARGTVLEKSTVGMYRSLLHQLLTEKRELCKIFDILPSNFLKEASQENLSTPVLKELFEEAVTRLDSRPCVCLIDALDECHEDEIRDMISFFGTIIQSRRRFQVCFSSRHYPSITIRNAVEVVLERETGHSLDISRYVHAELNIDHKTGAEDIYTGLKTKSSNIFLWVVLVVRILNKEWDRQRSLPAVKRKLHEVPSDLSQLFYEIMTSNLEGKDSTLLCIQWILFAAEPLTPQEFYYALLSGLEYREESLMRNPDDTTSSNIEQFILHHSRGLAELTASKEPTVQFIHESVRDFLLKERGISKVWNELDANFEGKSQDRLAKCCISYSNSRELSENLQNLKSYRAIKQSFPFLDHALRWAFSYANDAEGKGISQIGFLERFPTRTYIGLRQLHFKDDNGIAYGPSTTLLYLLAERNMSHLTRIYPEELKLKCLDPEESLLGNAFYAAILSSSHGVVAELVKTMTSTFDKPLLEELLVEYLKRPFGPGRDWPEPRPLIGPEDLVCWLAQNGDLETLRIVMELTDIRDLLDSEDRFRRTPLTYAIDRGKIEFFRFLLATGNVDPNRIDDTNQTPLYKAFDILGQTRRTGRLAVVKILLEAGAHCDQPIPDMKSALYLAVEEGLEDVVKLLLKHDADPSPQNSRAYLPLNGAIQNKNKEIARLLIDNGANVNPGPPDGDLPLSLAVNRDSPEMLSFLLGKGAQVDARDHCGETALYKACYYGYIECLKILLAHKANVNAQGGEHGSALDACRYSQFASSKAKREIVNLLLEVGAHTSDSREDIFRELGDNELSNNQISDEEIWDEEIEVW